MKIGNNVLPTRSLLCARNIIEQASCLLCDQSAEDSIHLFIRCPIAEAILFHFWGIHMDVLPFQHGKDIIRFCVLLWHQFKQDGLKLVLKFLLIADEIWQRRNQIRLGHKQEINIPDPIMQINE